jgi:hypothetical protein
MTLKNALHRMLGLRPKTWVAGGSSKKEQKLFTERKRNLKNLEKYRIIYEQGGIVTEAINSYPLFLTRNGYRLEGHDTEAQKVQDWLDATDFDMILWDGITDALTFGDAFQEIVLNRDKTPAYITPRIASSFEIQYDDHGKLSGYAQRITIEGKERKTNLKPPQIAHLQFWRLPNSMYGHSLIHRAYDDIIRDTKTAESTTEAIKRHGYRKYHIRVGQEGESVPQDVLTKVDKEFEELNEKNEFVTSRDIELSDIDATGLEQIDTYNDISILRMAAALGVPEEVLGLRRGSTDATATKRIDTFYGKISAMQQRVARCYNINIIDRITPHPGMVKLIFNEVNPDDETKRAKWITQVMKSSKDPFAVLPQDWIKKQFAIDVTKTPKAKKPEAQLEHCNGLILEAPHAELICRGMQKSIVKSVSLSSHVGEPLYLIGDGLCYGIVALDTELSLNQDEFQKTASRHLMADDANLKRKQKVFYYDIKLLSLFTEPRRCETPEGARNLAKKVEFVE